MRRYLEDFGVEIIGVDIDAIQITEDREKFRVLLDEIGIPMAPSETATSFLKGKEIAQTLWFSTRNTSVFYFRRYRSFYRL